MPFQVPYPSPLHLIHMHQSRPSPNLSTPRECPLLQETSLITYPLSFFWFKRSLLPPPLPNSPLALEHLLGTFTVLVPRSGKAGPRYFKPVSPQDSVQTLHRQSPRDLTASSLPPLPPTGSPKIIMLAACPSCKPFNSLPVLRIECTSQHGPQALLCGLVCRGRSIQLTGWAAFLPGPAPPVPYSCSAPDA